MTHLPLFDKDGRLFLALTSFILTLLIGWDAIINHDGMIYLTQAAFFSQGAFDKALSIYPWPGYSALIALVHTLGPSLEHAAVLINATCYALLMGGFVTAVRHAGGNLAVQWLAGVVLLIYPTLNGYRDMIVRDVGLWAMIFWGIIALARFHEKKEWRDVWLWTASMSIALLFRVEAVVLIALAPFGLLLITPRRSLWDVLRVQSIFIVLKISLLGWIFLTGHEVYLGRLQELPQYWLSLLHLGSGYIDRAHQLAQVLSPEFKSQYGGIALFGASVAYLLYIWIKVTTPFYVALSGLTMHQHWMPNTVIARYLKLFIGIGVFIILVFFLKRYFVSSRYVVMLGLFCIIPVAFAIHRIALARGQQEWFGRAWVLPATVLILIVMSIEGVLHHRHDQSYFRTSGEWIKTHVKPDAAVFISDRHIMFYADRLDMLSQKPRVRFRNAMKNDFVDKDIVVVFHDKNTPNVNAYLAKIGDQYPQIKFDNDKGEGVRVIVRNSALLSMDAHHQN